MEAPVVICLIVFVLIVIVAWRLLYRAVQRAKVKQAQFEQRFSKNYDRYPYRRPPWQ